MKIFFYVMDFVGPHNACIGLSQELKRRNHDIYFLTNPKFAEKFAKYGFGHIPVIDPKPKEDPSTDGGVIGDTDTSMKAMTQQFIDIGFFSDISPLEKIIAMDKDADVFEDMYGLCLRLEPQMKELLAKEKPDLLILDGASFPPCLIHSGIPWMTIFCSNPVGLFMSKKLPPFLSGFPTDSDPAGWEEFYEIANKHHYDVVRQYQQKLDKELGYPPLVHSGFFPQSPLLNLYQFPKELDYDDLIKIPDNMIAVDAFCREEVDKFELPPEFAARMKPGDKLIYVSMGSLGTNDYRLMKRLVTVLAKTPHWYIFSRGLNHDEYELADNMTGDIYVPQTKILPMVDMAIIHGGNNTLTESLFFGKPVLVLPIFYDQYDNAQRVVEKGVGRQLNTFRFTEQELIDSVESILADKKMKQKTEQIAENIRQRNSKVKVCERIEQAVEEFHRKQ